MPQEDEPCYGMAGILAELRSTIRQKAEFEKTNLDI
jgi:hypothetical protein